MYETIKKDFFQNLPKAEVLDVIEKDKTFKRKKGSGRPAEIGAKQMVAKLRAYFNHKSGQHIYLGEMAICIMAPLTAKEVNPANVPKARPVEDFWGNLKAKAARKQDLHLPEQYGPKGCTRLCQERVQINLGRNILIDDIIILKKL
ncbi:hypothetical protein BpHYR1_019298 [Brachionus plicatilis]|uniref:Uncharacterized protein n=1 Tax=Brachionus plicatilis TaxID=10195 RepID=A0A3M7RH33_BRAPC|nr:hypothetical protein BpHYR1_019298 [Brachionus plicatilis]